MPNSRECNRAIFVSNFCIKLRDINQYRSRLSFARFIYEVFPEIMTKAKIFFSIYHIFNFLYDCHII
jgi:hypothetical protein